MNGLGSEGAEAMGKALKVNRTLLQMDLSYNRIPEVGAGYLAVGLQTNDTLQGLKVIYVIQISVLQSFNPLRDKISMYFINAFRKAANHYQFENCLTSQKKYVGLQVYN